MNFFPLPGWIFCNYNFEIMTQSGKTIRLILVSVILIFSVRGGYGQAQIPEILQEGTLQEQLDYIQERTIIYNNFRAIREDMFLLTKKNSLDSLANAKKSINNLRAQLNSGKKENDSLSGLLRETRNELNYAVDNRDNIALLGMPMNKMSYNLIVWAIIGSLSVLLVFGLFLYNRNRIVMVNTRTEIEELRNEFEEYKKSSREKREQLVMEHFNEIKKLKES
jgi:hypothetical protein